MPSRMPATGSPAVMVGSEECSGRALNLLCISSTPTAPAALAVDRPACITRAEPVKLQDLQGLPGQRVLDAEDQARAETGERSPVPAGPVPPGQDQHGRDDGDDRGQRPVRERAERLPDGLGRPGQLQQPLPAMSSSAPAISVTRTVWCDSGTARISANSRLVVSSGSTIDSSRFPMDHAARIWPAIMAPMPASQSRFRNRSPISLGLRKWDCEPAQPRAAEARNRPQAATPPPESGRSPRPSRRQPTRAVRKNVCGWRPIRPRGRLQLARRRLRLARGGHG